MLRDLKTSLKSLKFGNDRIGGGSSNEPYIVTPLPDDANSLQRIKIEAGNYSYDFPVRGGALSLVNSAEDTIRIAKFLLDAPKGPLFIIKQVGLQLSNPKIETGKALGIENTRIYNLGLNTLSQVAVNAFGIHLDRSGLLPAIADVNKYAEVVKAKNLYTPEENRLVKLKDNFAVGIANSQDLISQTQIDAYNKITARLNKFNNSRFGKFANLITGGGFGRTLESVKEKAARELQPTYYKIDDYVGGPGSVYGLGNTVLNRYDFTDRSKYIDRVEPDLELNYQRFLGLSHLLYSMNIVDDKEQALFFVDQTSTTKTSPLIQTEGSIFSTTHAYDEIASTVKDKDFTNSHLNSLTFDYQLIKQQQLDKTKSIPEDFRKIINKDLGAKLLSTDYAKLNMETRIGIGNPGKPSRDRSKISINDPDTVDKINMLPLFTNEIGLDGKIAGMEGSTRDLIKFRMEVVNNDAPQSTVKVVFRAFINDFKANYNSDWDSYNYNGRGEDFYTQKKFKSAYNLSYKIAAQSRQEMKPLYQKLNYLISSLAPDYSKNGFMRGNFVLLTFGNWCYRQPVIINNLALSTDKNYPWEIAIDEPEEGDEIAMAELPQILDVNMQFTPIYNFIPRKGPTIPFIQTPTNPKFNWLKPDEFENLK